MRTRPGHHQPRVRWWLLLCTWLGMCQGMEEVRKRDWDRMLQVGIVYQRAVEMKQFVASWIDLIKHTIVWDPRLYATYKFREDPNIKQKLEDAMRSLSLDVRRSFLQSDLELAVDGVALQALVRRAMKDKCDVVVLLEPTVKLTPRWLNPLVAALSTNTVVAAVSPINNQIGFRHHPKVASPRNAMIAPNEEGKAMQNASAEELARLAFLLSNNSVISITEFEGFVTAFPFDVLEREFFIMQEKKTLWRTVAEALQNFLGQLKDAGHQFLLVPKSYVYVEDMQPPALQPELKLIRDMNADGALKFVRPKEMVRPNFTWHCRPLLMAKRKFTTHLTTSLLSGKRFSVLFVLNKMSIKPYFAMRGGWISIVQECLGLALHNVHVRMAIPSWTATYFEAAFPEAAERKIFLPFDSMSTKKVANELIQRKETFDFLVATLFTTVPTVEKLHSLYPNSIKSYYVQDIENQFDPTLAATAASSYRSMANGFVFVKTQYLAGELLRLYGIKAQIIPPTVDTNRFNPGQNKAVPGVPLVTCGMVRTSTPRRNPFGTYKVLANTLAKHGPDKVKAIMFGSTLEEIQEMLASKGESATFPAGLEFLGNLDRAEVASLLRTCDLFLDFSAWQAFGRSGLECMASGCIPVLPIAGGSSDFAIHGKNALLVNSSDVAMGMQIIDQVLNNAFDLVTMRNAAIEHATQYSISRSGSVTSELFRKILVRKRRSSSFSRPEATIPC